MSTIPSNEKILAAMEKLQRERDLARALNDELSKGIIELVQLTRKAHALATDLQSRAAGNPAPKVGI